MNEPLHTKQTHRLIEVFTGKVPFSDCIAYTAMLNIMRGMRPERPTHPGFTDDLWMLTQQCWKEDPQGRPQIALLIEQLLVPSSIERGDFDSSMTAEALTRFPTRFGHNSESIRTGVKPRKRAHPPHPCQILAKQPSSFYFHPFRKPPHISSAANLLSRTS